MCDRFGHDPFVDVWPSLHLPSLFHHGYTIIFHKQRMENNMPQHQRTEGKWDLIRNKIQETSYDEFDGNKSLYLVFVGVVFLSILDCF
jgi:hypothetical protein